MKAVQQPHQGAWSRWEEVQPIRVSWNRLLRWEDQRIRFLVGGTYDVLCTPANLVRWGIAAESSCHACGAPRATLEHILASCPAALRDGRYTWRHNRVLEALEREVSEFLSVKSAGERKQQKQGMRFVREGAKGGPGEAYSKAVVEKRAPVVCDWQVRADLGGTRTVPTEVCGSEQRPDLVIWSAAAGRVILAEVTVPWESRMEKAHLRKTEKYTDLADRCRMAGWATNVYPIEIGCRGFVSQSCGRFVREGLGAGPRFQRRLGEIVSEQAQLASAWILHHFRKGQQ